MKKQRKLLKTVLEFLKDMVNEPERVTDADEAEKTLYEAKELIKQIEKEMEK